MRDCSFFSFPILRSRIVPNRIVESTSWIESGIQSARRHGVVLDDVQSRMFSGIQYMNTPKPQQQQQQKKGASSAPKPPNARPRAQRPRPAAPKAINTPTMAAGYAKEVTNTRPRIKADGLSCRIRHQEMVTKVSMTALFATTAIPLNPGLPGSFPWLATQAQGWDTYRFNSLRFVFYTRVGSTSAGAIILGPEYDASDTTPVSEQVLSAYADAKSGVIYRNLTCELRPEGMHALGPKKFIRFSLLSPNQDIKTYDAGTFYVATVDGLVGPAGVLWAEYDITFSNPQLSASGAGAAYMRLGSAGNTSTTANILGVTPTNNSLAIFGTMSGNTFTFTSAGRFNIDLFLQAVTSVTAAANVLGGGAVAVDYGGPAGNTTARYEDAGVYDVIVGSTIQWPVLIVGVASGDLNITPLLTRVPY